MIKKKCIANKVQSRKFTNCTSIDVAMKVLSTSQENKLISCSSSPVQRRRCEGILQLFRCHTVGWEENVCFFLCLCDCCRVLSFPSCPIQKCVLFHMQWRIFHLHKHQSQLYQLWQGSVLFCTNIMIKSFTLNCRSCVQQG